MVSKNNSSNPTKTNLFSHNTASNNKNYTDSHTVWQKCLETIKKEVNEQSFNTWFLPIRAMLLEHNILTVQIPSRYFYEILETRFIYVIRRAIIEHLGVQGQIRYSILPAEQKQVSNFPKKTPSQFIKTQSNELSREDVLRINPKPSPIQTVHNINPSLTFENFVAGECNSTALAAAIAVAKKPGGTGFHPLILFSDVGLGKTHLAHAIGNRILQTMPNKRVMYVSADKFANDFAKAASEKQIGKFTSQYYPLDILIVDDVQFLCDKAKTQEIFFHVFNHLHTLGKQIVLTSDTPPSELKGLQERLLSRFKWGAILDLLLPSLETRRAIVNAKLSQYEQQISPEVISFIAQNVATNVREIEGVITSLLAKSSLSNQAVTLDLARQALGVVVAQGNVQELSIEAIEEIVAAFFQLSIEQIRSKRRQKEIATARQFVMFLTRKYTNLTQKAIAYHFNKKDHTTVLHACETVPKKVAQNEHYNKLLGEITKRIEQL